MTTALAPEPQTVGAPAIVKSINLSSDAMRIEPVSTALGAEVINVHLGTAAQDEGLIAAIRRGLLDHKVLFFRDQRITPAEHVAFARRFGELEIHPVLVNDPSYPELVTFHHDAGNQGTENAYHTDVSWRQAPSMGSVLRCLACPPLGGDTIWVNMGMAYERLPAEHKARLEGMMAMHDIGFSFGGRADLERRTSLRAEYPPQEHPVVRTMPETGEKVLYVNQSFTTNLCNYRGKFEMRTGIDNGMQSALYLNYLFTQAMIPEYQVRLKWRPDTVAFWDNRCTQHYAVQDYYPAVRHMQRATIVGEKPV